MKTFTFKPILKNEEIIKKEIINLLKHSHLIIGSGLIDECVNYYKLYITTKTTTIDDFDISQLQEISDKYDVDFDIVN